LATRFDSNGYFEAGGTEHSIHLGEDPDELIVEIFGVGNFHFLEEVFEYQEDPPRNSHHKDVQQAAPTSEVASQVHPSPVDGAGKSNRQSETSTETSPPVESGENATPDDEDWSKYPVVFSVLGVLRISLSPLYADEAKIEIIWRTMICDQKFETQRKAPPECESHFRSYVDHVKFLNGIVNSLDHVRRIQDRVLNSPLRVQIHNPEQFCNLARRVGVDEREEAGKFERAAQNFCHSMRVTITDTRAAGMVPRCTQKGDVVVVVKGVNVPLVPRREGHDRFKVGGQAYSGGLRMARRLRWMILRKKKLCQYSLWHSCDKAFYREECQRSAEMGHSSTLSSNHAEQVQSLSR